MSPKDLRALKAFRGDYPEARVALVYMGRDALMIDGIPVMGCDAFLRQLHPGAGLPV